MLRRDFLTAAPMLGLGGAAGAGAAGLPAGMLDVTVFGAAGDGRADDAPAVVRALAALPEGGGALVFPPGSYRLGRALAVPERVALLMPPGAVLVLPGGVDLTLHGALQAGRTRVFEGEGGVVFDGWAVDALFPEWWGARPDGESDSTAGLSAALRALEVGKVRTLSFGRGVYMASGPLALQRDGARLLGNRSGIRWTADTDGLRLDGRHLELRGLTLRGPGFAHSSGVGLRVHRPETWPKTTDRYELADLHVIDWDVGVRLENLELVRAEGWRVDYNKRNTDLLDGGFNTFMSCRWSNAQGPVNMRVSGERGIGNGSGSTHNTFVQCEWLETPEDGVALQLGEPGFLSAGNVILKADFEKTRGAVALRVAGAGNVLVAPFFHAVAGGIEMTSPDELLVLAPRFTSEGFTEFTARAAEGASVTLDQPLGMERGRGAVGGVRSREDGRAPVLHAPDGTRYRLRVDEAGRLGTEPA